MVQAIGLYFLYYFNTLEKYFGRDKTVDDTLHMFLKKSKPDIRNNS